MTQPNGPKTSAQVVTFHARVAGVGLVTTVVVLIAACLTFMLQQWAVARTHSHQIHQSLAQITAATAAPAVVRGEVAHIKAPLSSLSRTRSVVSARLTDTTGRPLASYLAADAAEAASVETEEISADVLDEGKKVAWS